MDKKEVSPVLNRIKIYKKNENSKWFGEGLATTIKKSL
jgi:hypothetical protein